MLSFDEKISVPVKQRAKVKSFFGQRRQVLNKKRTFQFLRKCLKLVEIVNFCVGFKNDRTF